MILYLFVCLFIKMLLLLKFANSASQTKRTIKNIFCLYVALKGPIHFSESVCTGYTNEPFQQMIQWFICVHVVSVKFLCVLGLFKVFF